MKKEKIVALVLTVAVGISTSPFGNLVSLAENGPDYLPEYFNIVTNSDAERNMVASSSNVLKYEQDNLERIIDQGIQYTPIYSIEDLKNMERDYKKNYILMKIFKKKNYKKDYLTIQQMLVLLVIISTQKMIMEI